MTRNSARNAGLGGSWARASQALKNSDKVELKLDEPENSLKITSDVSNLFKEIIETLDENGEELLADNILFRCNKLGLISKNIILEQRNLSANKVINKYTLITGGVILVNPLPVVDFITTTSVNVQMILEISKIYDFKITKKEEE